MLPCITQQPLNVTYKDNVKIFVNITDDSGISQVVLSLCVNGTKFNLTMTYNATLGLYIAEIPAYPAGTNITYFVIAVDIYGNKNVSSIYSYVVKEYVPDTIPPEFIIVWCEPDTPTNVKSVIILANITDESDISCVILSYAVNGVWTNVTMSYNATSGLYIAYIPRMPSGTVVQYKIYATDKYGNTAVSPIFTYTVVEVDTLPPHIENLRIIPEVPTDADNVTIMATIVDNSNISVAILSYSNDTMWYNITMTRVNDTFIATLPAMEFGTAVQFRIYANDTLNNWLISDVYSYVVSGATRRGREIEVNETETLNVTIIVESEEALEVNITIEEISANASSLSEPVLEALESEEFRVLNRTIEIVANETITSESNVTIHIRIYYTDEEINALGIDESSLAMYFWNETAGRWQRCEVTGVNIEENYVWANVTHLTLFMSIADVVSPNILNVTFEPVQPFENETVTVSAIVEDASGVSTVILSYYNGTSWVNITMTRNEESIYVAEIPRLPAGTEVQFKIYACDLNRNWNVTSTFSYTVLPVEMPSEGAPILSGDLILYVAIGALVVVIIILVIRRRR